MKKLTVIENTVFKDSPTVQSYNLPLSSKRQEDAGREYEIAAYEKIGDHLRIFLDSRPWFAYEHHVEIYQGDKRVHPRPQAVKLDIPYLSQLDNRNNPTGSCNVTSIGMCLKYFGEEARHGQLEDELYEYALSMGYSHHSGYDLARIVRDYGYKDTFKENATLEEVRDWLTDGNPSVIHGYFTSFGHIVTVVGFDEDGLFIHDPYGEWFSTGYRTDLSGANLHYSYELIRRTCMHDGNLWAHFISR